MEKNNFNFGNFNLTKADFFVLGNLIDFNSDLISKIQILAQIKIKSKPEMRFYLADKILGND